MKENKDNSSWILMWIFLFGVIVLYFIASDWKDETEYCLDDVKQLKEELYDLKKKNERDMQDLINCYEKNLEQTYNCKILIIKAKNSY